MNLVIKDPEVVIDLETLDTVGSRKKFPIILSIGAAKFDPTVVNTPEEMVKALANGNVEEENVNTDKVQEMFLSSEVLVTENLFYSPVSLMQSMANGMTYSVDTIQYWEKQTYNMVAIAAQFRDPIRETLVRFAQWLKTTGAKRVWANAPTFDISILREVFDHLGMQIEINFRSERDVRGMVDFTGVKWPETPKYFVRHNALCDSILEAIVIQRAYQQRREWQTAVLNNTILSEQIANQQATIEELQRTIEQHQRSTT